MFLSYVLSFVFIGIYWNNHHHLLQAVERVNGSILWANLHLLFWLSLMPFVTGWMGENHFAPLPTALYGVVLLMAGVAYYLLVRAILAHHGQDSRVATALGRDFKGKISVLFYLVALPLAFVNRWVAVRRSTCWSRSSGSSPTAGSNAGWPRADERCAAVT